MTRRLMVACAVIGLACAGGEPDESLGIPPAAISNPAAAPEPSVVLMSPVAVGVAGAPAEYPVPESAKYPLVQALDGDFMSAWVVPTGSTAWFEFAAAVELSAIEIVPGYAKNAKTWSENRRPTRLRYRLLTEASSADSEQVSWVEAEIPSRTFDASHTPVSIDVPSGARAVRMIELEFIASEDGTKSKDVCVSEVAFRGKGAAGAPSGPWQLLDPTLRKDGALTAGPSDSDWFSIDPEACKLRFGRGPKTIELEEGAVCLREGDHLVMRGQFEGGAWEQSFGWRDISPCLALVDGYLLHRPGCGPVPR